MTFIDLVTGLGIASPILFGGLITAWLKLRSVNKELLSVKLAHSKLQLVHYCAVTEQ